MRGGNAEGTGSVHPYVTQLEEWHNQRHNAPLKGSRVSRPIEEATTEVGCRHRLIGYVPSGSSGILPPDTSLQERGLRLIKKYVSSLFYPTGVIGTIKTLLRIPNLVTQLLLSLILLILTKFALHKPDPPADESHHKVYALGAFTTLECISLVTPSRSTTDSL